MISVGCAVTRRSVYAWPASARARRARRAADLPVVSAFRRAAHRAAARRLAAACVDRHARVTSFKRGPWTVDRGPWTVDRGPWTVDRGPWVVTLAPSTDH